MNRRLRAFVKHAALSALGSAPVVGCKIRRIAAYERLTILNLHRVAEHDASSYSPVDPRLFDELLRFVKRHFETVTFAEVAEARRGGRPKLILSFDDGYKDFIEVAAPLLDSHGVRANLNIIPACVESGQPPLNVIVQDFIGRAPAEAIERLVVPGFAISTPLRSRVALGNTLSAFLKQKPIAEQEAIGAILIEQLSRTSDFAPTPMMTLDEVSQVAAFHEIGAHSFAHANMAAETDDYLRVDLKRCRAWLWGKLGVPLNIYAFPNGSYRPGQIGIVRAAGVRDVLLVDEEFSSAGAHVHPRHTFDALSVPEMRFRATGAYSWPKRRRAVA